MASPASRPGMGIPGPKNPGKPDMFIQPIVPKPKLTKAQKYRNIKQTKEVNPIYKTY
jgi:hypothetical protein